MRAPNFLLAAMMLPALPLLAAAAPDPVAAYIARQQADAARASDQLVANHLDQLVNDPNSPVIGDPKGDVAIVEFFDYACPYCKAVEPRLRAFVKADRHIKYVLKEFPILTPGSMIATKAALAAMRQGKYMPFHFAMMDYKGELTADAVFDTAKSVGLDVARLKKDMQSPDVTGQIIANFNLARGLRIFQTPGFVIGGHIPTGNSSDIDFPKRVAAARGK